MATELIDREHDRLLSEKAKKKLRISKEVSQKQKAFAIPENIRLSLLYEAEGYNPETGVEMSRKSLKTEIIHYADTAWAKSVSDNIQNTLGALREGRMEQGELNSFRLNLIYHAIDAFLNTDNAITAPIRDFLNHVFHGDNRQDLIYSIALDVIFYLSEMADGATLSDGSNRHISKAFLKSVIKCDASTAGYNKIEKLKKNNWIFKNYFKGEKTGIWAPLYFFKSKFHNRFMHFAFNHSSELPKGLPEESKMESNPQKVNKNNTVSQALKLFDMVNGSGDLINNICVLYYLDYYYKFFETAQLKICQQAYGFSENIIDALRAYIVETPGVATRQRLLLLFEDIAVNDSNFQTYYFKCIKELLDNKTCELNALFGNRRSISSYHLNWDIGIPIFAKDLNLELLMTKIMLICKDLFFNIEEYFIREKGALSNVTLDDLEVMIALIYRRKYIGYSHNHKNIFMELLKAKHPNKLLF